MANVLVQETSLTAIADAIRSKNGEETTYKPAEMAPAIAAIETSASLTLGSLQMTTVSKYFTDTDHYLDLSPYVSDISQVKWVLIDGPSIDDGYDVCLIWSPALGTKYFIQVGGGWNGISITGNIGIAFKVADDAEEQVVPGGGIATGDTGQLHYLETNGVKIRVLTDDGTLWGGTQYATIFYEE